MKRLAFSLLITLSLTGSAWAQQAGTAPVHSSQPSAKSLANQIVITSQEWQELRTARASAIKAHPELVAENSALMQKISAFETKLNAAMAKTDPTVSPLLTKFDASRPQAATTASTPPPVSPSSPAK